MQDKVTIARVTDPAAVQPILDRYVRWVFTQTAVANGVQIDDFEQVVERHHRILRTELSNLLSPRGRLLAARFDGRIVGIGALRPVDATTAEIKRMYVEPDARGRGIGGALLEQLVAAARNEGFRTVRLETAKFMTAAQTLYRSAGFRDVEPFEDSETAVTQAFEGLIVFMQRRLG